MIDGIEKNLALQEHHTEPSRATLRDYGNTSSSSIWCVPRFWTNQVPIVIFLGVFFGSLRTELRVKFLWWREFEGNLPRLMGF